MTSTDGIVIDERLVIKSDAPPAAVRADGVAEPRASSWPWMEVARGVAASCARVWGMTRNDIAVVTNVAPDHPKKA